MKTHLFATGLCLLAGNAFAENTNPISQSEALEPIEINITANRHAQTIDETIAPVTVITREDIQKYGSMSLPDILKYTSNISLTNTGGVGKQTTTYLRGSTSSNILVLVDGAKISSATTGTAALEHIPVDLIEKVEIVRGPRSSLYGSEAVGGVIQIFTQKFKQGLKPSLQLRAGSHRTQGATVGLSAGNQNSWGSLSLSAEKTDGFNAVTNDTEDDKDGYKRNSINLQAGHRFNNGLIIEGSALKAKGNNQYDQNEPNNNPNNDFEIEAISLQANKNINQRLNIQVSASQTQDKSSFQGSSFNPSHFNTKRQALGLQSQYQFGRWHRLTTGADFQRDTVDSSSDYDQTSVRNRGIYANYQFNKNAAHFDIALRRDRHDQFGSHTTGSLGYAHQLNDQITVKASYGEAFKAPTFNDLYGAFGGNPNLLPEESQNREVSIAGDFNRFQWEATVFKNTTKNIIQTRNFVRTNIDSAQVKGVELSGKTQLGRLNVNANVTLQKTKDEQTNRELSFRPQKIANLGLNYQWNQFSVGGNLHAESKRFTNAANTSELPGFAVLDVNTQYQLRKDLSLSLNLNNALDKNYVTNSSFGSIYAQDGRNLMVSVTYQP